MNALKKVSVFFVVFAFILSAFSITSHAEEAQPQPSNLQMLTFSSLSYYDMEAASAQTTLSVGEFLSSTKQPYAKITKEFKDELKSQNVSVEDVITKAQLNDWKVYKTMDKWDIGFYGVIFKNVKTDQYVLTYRGTNGGFDYITDLLLATKNYEISQTGFAKLLVSELPEGVNKDHVFATGHSLGGYLGARVGAEKGFKTVVFNAPGFQKDYLKSLRDTHVFKYENYVTNQDIKYDLVSNWGHLIGERVVYKGYKHGVKNFYAYIR
ncbi:type I secretion target GGXGXDXXX repeat-containing protein [Fictibacillus macauensis ZFHKF-1]|uniref:Type I secretion target GGXGXDXXX repeat-containing protein n=1 Tax=Fictibacillus macauensis ZFHKF-1 TaxID=1196324 RepID=I8UHE2_9BACL|nr:hypothetical protein [Fictibacillus macauensis]EIT86243.1 type I secretion target GGXGXDXXX repeat-containing protein [Fictibacillus macauensis ZFHKF-1]